MPKVGKKKFPYTEKGKRHQKNMPKKLAEKLVARGINGYF
jgi:hypothetical protein